MTRLTRFVSWVSFFPPGPLFLPSGCPKGTRRSGETNLIYALNLGNVTRPTYYPRPPVVEELDPLRICPGLLRPQGPEDEEFTAAAFSQQTFSNKGTWNIATISSNTIMVRRFSDFLFGTVTPPEEIAGCSSEEFHIEPLHESDDAWSNWTWIVSTIRPKNLWKNMVTTRRRMSTVLCPFVFF
jgi:hypothetical protein